MVKIEKLDPHQTGEKKEYNKPALREFGGLNEMTKTTSISNDQTLDYQEPSYLDDAAS